MRAHSRQALLLIGLVVLTLVPPSAFAGEHHCDCCPCPCHCVCKDPDPPTPAPTTTKKPTTTTPTPPPPDTTTSEICEVGCLDLGFIVDGSFSITPENWVLVKDFLMGIIDQFKIDKNLVQTALVQFSKATPNIGMFGIESVDAQVEWNYTNPANANINDLLDALDDVIQLAGFTDYATAMELYLNEVLPTLRNNPEECDVYTHAVIFFTDGLFDIRVDELPGLCAQLLAATGDLVFGVGVSESVNETQLLQCVDDPSKVILLPDFADLADQLAPFVFNICTTIRGTFPTPAPTTEAPTAPPPVPPSTPPPPPGPRQCYCCCPPFFPPWTKTTTTPPTTTTTTTESTTTTTEPTTTTRSTTTSTTEPPTTTSTTTETTTTYTTTTECPGGICPDLPDITFPPGFFEGG